jgi:hypothetical protein
MVHVAVSKYNWQDSASSKFGSPISPLKCQKKNRTGPKYIFFDNECIDNGCTRQSLVKHLVIQIVQQSADGSNTPKSLYSA